MTHQVLLAIFCVFLIQQFVGCGTNEVNLECDVSETHTTNKNACSFGTVTCIIEEFRDVFVNHVKLSFTNARDENFTAMVFQNCYLPTLPSEVFAQFLHLEALDMSNTGIRSIQGNTFKYATELTELNLSNNQLTEVAAYTFTGATNLRSLRLANNRIVKISISSFRDTTKLEFVDLCHNLIQIIHKETFSMLSNLRNVYLYRNSIIDVNPQSFVLNKQLNTLDLAGNVLREVELELSSPRINKLDVSNCSLDELTLRKSATDATEDITIRYLNAFKNELSNITKIRIDKGIKLQNVDLSENKLNSLTFAPDFVQDLTMLKLTKNDLWQITPGFMTRFKKLKNLYLDKNRVSLYQGMFKPVPDLKILSLTENHLKFFEFANFEGLKNLTQLNLEDNHLRKINYTLLMSTLPALQSLFLDNNEFSCSFIETMVNYERNTTEGKSIEFSTSGRGKYPTCVPDVKPSQPIWGWIVVAVIGITLIALMIVLQRQLVEKFGDLRRRLRSYSNMRETGAGPGSERLGDDGDD